MKKVYETRLQIEQINCQATPLCGKAYSQILLEELGKARSDVQVMQYAWRFYPNQPEHTLQKINQAILQQISNKVKYSIILNNFQGGTNLVSLNQSAERYLTQAGAKVKFGGKNIITHTKLWLIDQETAILGSHNLTETALTQNFETSIMVKSKEIVRAFKAYFDQIWNSI